jgi:hypothetical protein
MTPDDVRSQIMNALDASWATATSISWPNKDFIVPQVAWIQPVIKMGQSFVLELGDGVGLRTGVLMVSIFTPAGDGLKKAFDYAARLEAIYRRKDLSGVLFKEPYTDDKGRNDSGFNHVLMSVDFDAWVGE